jgi:hypothetical protein
MASRALRRAGDARGAVGSVTGRAALDALAVRRFRLGRVARGARNFGGTAVGLVAALAILVTGRSALVLAGVAALAIRAQGAAVRLVALRAFAVAAIGFSVLPRVAGIAADRERGGPVRQAGVTALARLVAGYGYDEIELLFVTAFTRGPLRQREHEIVRLVTLLARGPAVKVLLGRRDLMTAAAIANARVEARARRMRIVAAHASAGDAAPWVVRMLVAVAIGAGALRRAAHVVG